MKLIHIIDPSRLNDHRPAKVHYQSIDGQELLCGLGNVYREVDGEKFQVWQETKRPVTCHSCTQRVETIVRFQLRGLTSGQYEDLLAHIESFRAHK